MRLRKHFHWHRRRVGVQVRYHNDADCGAYAEAWKWESRTDHRVHGAVWLVEPISGTPSYFIAMHELGHLADSISTRGTLRLHNPRPMLEREAVAWEWALRNACVNPSKGVWQAVLGSLDSYARLSRNDRRMKQSKRFDSLHERARKEVR